MAFEATAPGEAVPAWVARLHAARESLDLGVWLLTQQTEPSLDLAPLGPVAQDALAAVYDALDRRADPLDGIRRATQQIDRLCAALAEDDAGDTSHARRRLEAARAALDEAEPLLARLPLVPLAPAAGPVMASGDLPRLHRVERASLVPEVRLKSPPAPPPDEPLEPLVPVTFEELEANIAMLKMRAEERRELAASKRRPVAQEPPPTPERPAGFGPDIPAQLSEGAFVRARARDMIEEVAMVGLQRTPLPGDPWRIALPLEQRMGRAIDAIAAMGQVALSHVEGWAIDSPIKDGTRLFAVAMTMGCFEGEDGLGVVDRVYREIASVDPTCRDGLVAALTLAPHPGIEAWMRRWLVDQDPARRAIAIETMAFRGWADDNELATAALDEPEVARRALVPLARQAPGTALDLLEQPLASDGELRRSAWRAMILANRGGASQVLRDVLAEADVTDEDRRRAAQLLALSGDESDANLLLEMMRAEPAPAIVDAVGWTGLVSAIGPLVAQLEDGDEAIAAASARALDRITGAHLMEEAEVAAEDIFVPEPPDPDVGEPPKKRLVRMTSDPRDVPPEPATETVERPSTNAAAWRAWHAEHGASWPARHRHRQGRPYTPRTSLDELDAGQRDDHERRLLLDELVIHTGAWVRMDPHDYVVTQQAALARWRGPVQRAGSQPGGWDRASRR